MIELKVGDILEFKNRGMKFLTFVYPLMQQKNNDYFHTVCKFGLYIVKDIIDFNQKSVYRDEYLKILEILFGHDDTKHITKFLVVFVNVAIPELICIDTDDWVKKHAVIHK